MHLNYFLIQLEVSAQLSAVNGLQAVVHGKVTTRAVNL